jgi:hypothetical protein
MIRYLFVYQNPGPADAVPESASSSSSSRNGGDAHRVPDVHVDQVTERAIRLTHPSA